MTGQLLDPSEPQVPLLRMTVTACLASKVERDNQERLMCKDSG